MDETSVTNDWLVVTSMHSRLKADAA